MKSILLGIFIALLGLAIATFWPTNPIQAKDPIQNVRTIYSQAFPAQPK